MVYVYRECGRQNETAAPLLVAFEARCGKVVRGRGEKRGDEVTSEGILGLCLGSELLSTYVVRTFGLISCFHLVNITLRRSVGGIFVSP